MKQVFSPSRKPDTPEEVKHIGKAAEIRLGKRRMAV